MVKKFLAGVFTVGALYLPLTANAAYDTSDLQTPQFKTFYLYSKQVDMNIEEQLQRARNLVIEEKDYRMALAVLNQVIELNSEVAEAYFLKAFAYGGIEEYDNADKEFQKALRIEPDNPTYYYFRGLNYFYWNGHTKDSMNMYMKALEIEPKYIDAIVGVGDCFKRYADSDGDTAKTYYTEKIKDSNSGTVSSDISLNGYWFSRYSANQNCDKSIKNYNKAIDEYNKVLVWFPRHGVILEKKKIAQRAIESLKNSRTEYENHRQKLLDEKKRAEEIENKINN